MYCEQTNIEQKTYSIQDIPEPVLQQLAKLLIDLNEPAFNRLQQAVCAEAGSIIGKRFFDKAWSEITLCERCGAVGYHKNAPANANHNFRADACLTCNGEGSRVKKIFVKYETIDENKRKRFACDGFRNNTAKPA